MMNQPKNLTKRPGIYLFKNIEADIIYIGKAKNIAQRVASYFAQPFDYKAQLILQEAITIETIPTQTEVEALYLEAQLIKQYQPKFNTLLKDGNPFAFILFSQQEIPTISIVRTKEKKGAYFGPFLSKKQAHNVCNFLITTLQLKLCKQKIPQGCLEYHIGICAGNCTNSFDHEFYRLKVNLAQELLKKNNKSIDKQLCDEIKNASKALQFEHAKQLTEYKNDLQVIQSTITKLSTMPSKQKNITPDKKIPLLIKVKNRLKLKHIPYVIDCFDISHMQGQTIVGACIRYVHGNPEKSSFRRFKITSLTNQNDYAALQEIVQRRYKNKDSFPNLVIIDGGIGQVNAVKPLLTQCELVGLAKKEETIIPTNLTNPIKLNVHNPEDALILQIRDYTHHFAISYHRKKRSILSS